MQHYKHDSNYFNNIKTVDISLYCMHSAAVEKSIFVHFLTLSCILANILKCNEILQCQYC